ncbi:hypothetical protein ID866_5244 [Astraeus odoratus]|nr:hypothetical protein ID866_5244 [Astraeus odoratus]
MEATLKEETMDSLPDADYSVNQPTYTVTICKADDVSRTCVFPVATSPATIFSSNASSLFDHDEGGISIWFMLGTSEAFLFQTIRNCRWQDWVRHVDVTSLDICISEGVVIYLTPPDVFPFDFYGALDQHGCNNPHDAVGRVKPPAVPFERARATYTIRMLRSQEDQIYHQVHVPVQRSLEELLSANTSYLFDGTDGLSIWSQSRSNTSWRYLQVIHRKSKVDLGWTSEVDWRVINDRIQTGDVSQISLTPPYILPFEADA